MNRTIIQDAILDAMDQEFKTLVENMSHDEALSTLGLHDDHSEEDLKTAYRNSSKKHHPDTGGSLEGMQKVNAAYEKLKDGVSRSTKTTSKPRPIKKSPYPNDHLWDMIHHESPKVRVKSALQPGLQSHHIHAILDLGDKNRDDDYSSSASDAAVHVLKHPNIDASHLHKAMDHWDSDVGVAALRHPKSEERHVDAGIAHWDDDVRLAAVKHPKVKLRHIEKALSDDDEGVRKEAIKHLQKRGVFKE